MATPLINGQAYDYASIIITMLGGPVVSAKSISYKEEQEKTNNFGQGNRPISRGKGAIEASASIDISMNDIEAIRDISPDRSLLKLPAFDVTVTYLNNQRVVTHVIKNCEFLNDGVETSQGDVDVVKSLDMVASHVVYN